MATLSTNIAQVPIPLGAPIMKHPMPVMLGPVALDFILRRSKEKRLRRVRK